MSLHSLLLKCNFKESVKSTGDELQLPPVPFEHSLLASTETTSDEHKAGVHIFSGFSHVYRLQTAMRFQDSVLVGILEKMRTPGGKKLTDPEWKALQATSVDGPQHAHKLNNTEHFFQACYTWSVVSLAYAVRSFESAKACGKTLYATRAIDVVHNVSRGQAAAVTEAVLAHTNINDTGRLPHFGLYHVGMEVRLTQTLAAPYVVVDCIGVIRGFKFAAEDEARGDLNGSFVVLRKLPEAIYVEFQDLEQNFLSSEPCVEHAPQVVAECSNCRRLRGMFVVRPYTNSRAWSLKVKLPASHGGGLDEVTVKVRRTQMPLVTVKASTLHVLQGTTTDPGLIFHWRFPRRLQMDTRWLASYVALSRVRSLERLRSVGLDARVREILEQGPPDTLPLRFRQLFAEKEAKTRDYAEQCLTTLGW